MRAGWLLVAGSAVGDRRYDGGSSPYGKATPSNFASLLPPTLSGVPMMLLLSKEDCDMCTQLEDD